MELRDALLGYTPMIVATGAIDHSTCAELRAALGKIFEARHSIVFLDLTGVDHIDSGGLAVLRSALQTLRRGWLGAIGPNADVRRLLETGGLASSPNLLVFETQQAALEATGARQST